MSDKRVIRSRKKDNLDGAKKKDEKDLAKTSIIKKVNSESNNNSSSNWEKSTETNNQEKKNNTNKKSDKMKQTKDKINNNNKVKKSKNFFKKLSPIGRISLVIYLVIFVVGGFLIGNAVLKGGNIIYGSRQEPVKVISNEQINQVKSALEKEVDAKAISVSYQGYRFVVVMDLGDNTTAKQGKRANYKAYAAIKKILPINEYFHSTDKLNNDLFIYSTDVVPSDYDTNSSYIFQTYKNSKMSKPDNYDLMKYRDKKSYEEVLDTMKQAKKDGNAGN